MEVGLGPFEFTIGLIFLSHPKWRRAVFQHDTIKPFEAKPKVLFSIAIRKDESFHVRACEICFWIVSKSKS